MQIGSLRSVQGSPSGTTGSIQTRDLQPRCGFRWVRTPVRLRVACQSLSSGPENRGKAEERESTRTGIRTQDQSVKSRVLYQLSYPRFCLTGGEGVGTGLGFGKIKFPCGFGPNQGSHADQSRGVRGGRLPCPRFSDRRDRLCSNHRRAARSRLPFPVGRTQF